MVQIIKKIKMEIVKSFDKETTKQDLTSGGVVNYCSWERLLPYLVQANGGSEVKGIVADELGIKIILK